MATSSGVGTKGTVNKSKQLPRPAYWNLSSLVVEPLPRRRVLWCAYTNPIQEGGSASFKEQVVVNLVRHGHGSRTHASRLIGVQAPAPALVFPDCLTDILVVLNLNAFIFPHLNNISSNTPVA
jgi:hypothetical protein